MLSRFNYFLITESITCFMLVVSFQFAFNCFFFFVLLTLADNNVIPIFSNREMAQQLGETTALVARDEHPEISDGLLHYSNTRPEYSAPLVMPIDADSDYYESSESDLARLFMTSQRKLPYGALINDLPPPTLPDSPSPGLGDRHSDVPSGTTGHYRAGSGECIVCLTDSAQVFARPCCSKYVCKDCLRQIVRLSVTEGIVHIKCPSQECDKALTDKEIVGLIGQDRNLLGKYDRFRLDYVKDGNKKTCPRCCLITEYKLPRKLRLKENDVKVKCTSCELDWCFKCHAPWHEGLSCKAFRTGDKQFHHWTKERKSDSIPNCQKCPLCRVFIERSTGCNHMTCRRCGTEFCYLCGEMFIPVIGYEFGFHNDKYSVLGCPYEYDGGTVERVAVRGSYAAAIISGLTGYPVLFVGGVALLLVAGLIALPFYAAYKLYRICRRYSDDYD